jgi:hypothetical protein
MNTFFKRLQSGEQAVSSEHSLVDVVSTEVRNGIKFVTCETIPTGIQSEDESIDFEAVEGELSCPVEWQINTAICACEARIDGGSNVDVAFKWLRDEVEKAYQWQFTYEFN